MSNVLRILLIAGAIFSFLYMIKKIRQAKLKIEHTVFWLFFSLVLIVMGVCPQMIFVLSEWMGFQSPVNFVFLMILFILIIKSFLATLQISHLEHKIDTLVQQVAIQGKVQEK